MTSISVSSLVFYGAIAAVGVALNVLVLTSFVRGQLYKAPNSSIYILALQTISVDLVFIALHLIYWIPKAVYPDFLSIGGLDTFILHITEIIGTYAWYHNALGHIFIAINRFAILVYYERPIFTRKRVILIAVFHHILAAIVTTLKQYIIPCCSFTFNFDIFSYVNVAKGDMLNYSDDYLTLPINIISTGLSLVCYASIFISVRRARKGQYLHGDHLVKQRNREYRYALQFASLAGVFSFCWISFRTIPYFIELSDPSLSWVFGLTTVSLMINCFMNAVVYLLNNSEVKRNLPFKCQFCSSEVATEHTALKTIETTSRI